MHVIRLLGSKLSIGVVAVVCAGGGAAAVLHFSGGSPARHSQVLGEKFTVNGHGNGNAGGGSSTPAPATKPGKGNTNNNNNNKRNGNGNGHSAPGKAFTISGTLSGLFPGVTSKLYLTVNNPNNQAMTVTNLTATVTSVTKAANAPAGTCAATAANLVIHAFTGPSFTVAANSSRSASPAYLPVVMPSSVANACQGATFTLSFSGTGTQA
jgi:hypothetical protein